MWADEASVNCGSRQLGRHRRKPELIPFAVRDSSVQFERDKAHRPNRVMATVKRR